MTARSVIPAFLLCLVSNGSAAQAYHIPVPLVPGSAIAAGGPDVGSSDAGDVETAQVSRGWQLVADTLLLRRHTTRIVVINTALLGLAAGLIGSFAYLRKRALMGDALSHATLPGVVAAFLVTGSKSMLPLMLGAAVTGIIGVLTVIFISRYSRLKEDTAIGIVLSVFFGAGLTLLSVVQGLEGANAAGLQDFIYGKPASLTLADSRMIQVSAIFIIVVTIMLFKEFKSICFDQAFASVIGRPVLLFDILMMALVVLVTVIGLQAVGLILIVALLIVPPAAARFWTDNLNTMTITAAIFGVASGYLGACVSALTPKMPTGAVIILVAGLLFAASMLVAPHRGVLSGLFRDVSLRRRIACQNVLRALAELEESILSGEIPSSRPDAPAGQHAFTIRQLLTRRSWSASYVKTWLRCLFRRGLVVQLPGARVALTPEGRIEARRLLRNHRLWEIYLIRHADIAPSHVDRDADEIEHVLPSDLIHELECALGTPAAIPPSPHPVN